MLINPELKIYEFYIEPSLSVHEKTKIYEYLVSYNKIMLDFTNFRLTNFEILDYHYYFNELYDEFQKCVHDLFGRLTIVEPNKRCYAYVTSINDKKSNLWHDHTKTSSIS